MNIGKYIEKRGKDNEFFKKALLSSYDKYKDKGIRELDEELDRAKERYKIQRGTYQSVADCFITYELLKEKLET